MIKKNATKNIIDIKFDINGFLTPNPFRIREESFQIYYSPEKLHKNKYQINTIKAVNNLSVPINPKSFGTRNENLKVKILEN